ncbi:MULTISPECIES: hypothetical protein [Yersinia]|uniref:hypothetical protein n=1 Tax=Yersinia TaxID=629 RepID=UPI0005DC422E|nr:MULTISPECIES: hypothetical protein [Yersinia]CNL28462.1 Uncharacterised protein [Yersinia frederiksenii]
MNHTIHNLFLLFIFFPLIHAFAASEPSPERKVLSSVLNQSLLCVAGNGKDRAGAPERDSFLKKAGASIITDGDAYFNRFRYSFIEPLEMGHLLLYSVQQEIGEGGVIFIAEVEGDLSAFVRKINAQSAKEQDDFLGVSNIRFYKLIQERVLPDYTKIVVGQNRIQKAQGRFFYGCIQTIDLG